MEKIMGIGRREFIGAGVASLFAGNLLARPAEDEVKFCAFADIHYYPGMFPHDTREWLERVLDRAEKAHADFIIHNYMRKPSHFATMRGNCLKSCRKNMK